LKRSDGLRKNIDPRFNIGMKEDPDYNPYGTSFTERQMQIICGVPVDNLKKQEISIIMKKADKMGIPSIAERVYVLHEEMYTGPKVKPKYTHKEALEGLQKLTPWER